MTDTLYIYDWKCESTSEETLIRIYGLDACNRSVVLFVDDFTPYLYIELPKSIQWNARNVQLLYQALEYIVHYTPPVKKKLASRRRLYYAHIDKNYEPQYYQYLMLYFQTSQHMRRLQSILTKPLHVQGMGRLQLKVHETHVSPILQLVCSQNLYTTGWISFKGDLIEHPQTYADEEYQVSYRALHRCTDRHEIPAPRILSFDIEVYSSNPNAMPNAQRPSDCVFQISCIFSVQGSHTHDAHLLTLGTPTPSIVGEHVHIHPFKSEASLLIGFTHLVQRYNPQIITGYNILGFDMQYMIQRAQYNMVSASFSQLGMMRGVHGQTIHDQWANAAYGNQDLMYVEAEGRIYIDLLIYARREFKFSSFKLDFIASYFLNAQKDPLTARDIFTSYERGMTHTPDGHHALAVCGKYCIRDSDLVLQLFETFDTWIGLVEMAGVCYVPCSYLYTKGQQIKVFSQVYKYCYDHKIVVEQNAYQADGRERYQGAMVIDPVPGLYEYVVPMDFKSLYPSIMIAYNIDYSTLVPDHLTIPDDKCHIIEWSEHQHCEHTETPNLNAETYVCQDYRYRFLKHPTGVLPSIVQHLLDMRTKTRQHMNDMKKTLPTLSDDEQTRMQIYLGILNKRQLSYKVSCNSMYGTLGVKRGKLPCMPAAMCITAIGRENLVRAAQFLKFKCGARVVYGDTDSNYVQFPHIDPAHLWDHARTVEQLINNAHVFKHPLYLEFENEIYAQFLILSKKRYLWRNFNEDGSIGTHIGKKGVLLARRDNSAFIRNLYEQVVADIFDKRSFHDTLNAIIDALNTCCAASLPQTDFIVTKSVGDPKAYKIRALPTDPKKRQKRLDTLGCDEHDYIHRALPAQVQLAERMRARGIRIDVGQRIEYVITTMNMTRPTQQLKLFDKIEDPVYQQRYAPYIKLDYLYYIKLLTAQVDQLIDTAYSQHLRCSAPSSVPRRLGQQPTFKVGKTSLGDDQAMYHRNSFIGCQYKLRLYKAKVLHDMMALFKPRIVFKD